MKSPGTSPGAFPSGCLVFQSVCHFHRYWAYNSKSTVWPKMESCFQDGACSVCFLLHSRLLTLLTHNMIVIYRDIMHPASPTSDLGERHQPMCYKVQIHCKIQGAQSRTIKTTIPMVNIVFHQIPFTQDRTEVQKGRLSSDITFTWTFMSFRVADI